MYTTNSIRTIKKTVKHNKYEPTIHSNTKIVSKVIFLLISFLRDHYIRKLLYAYVHFFILKLYKSA